MTISARPKKALRQLERAHKETTDQELESHLANTEEDVAILYTDLGDADMPRHSP